MKILLIEDEPPLLERLYDVVKECKSDAEIFSFDSSDEVIEHISADNSPVDVAFLDIELGEVNGIELAKKIKYYYPKCDIVFCTGYSEYAVDAFKIGASDYLLKPVTKEKVLHAFEQLRASSEVTPEANKLYIRTFGEFEIFYNGFPVMKMTKRAKELFAYLIDKQGALCTSNDIINTVFYNLNDANFRVAKQNLSEKLSELGIGDILIKEWGKLSVNTEKVVCDYYEYLKGNPHYINNFKGSYMSQYEWAKQTENKLKKL